MAGSSKSEAGGIYPGMTGLPASQRQMLMLLQSLSLGLFRSDYMVHQEDDDATPVVKQVEFNTIASSFGGLSAETSNLHK
jgi:hypothetical protein